ncbi:MAG: SH3 domain-containing protein, partial [Acidobacteriota bacterium]
MKVSLLVLALILGASLLPAAPNAQERATKIKVTAEQANLREKPDIGSAVVQQIPEGTILESDRKEGEWYLVRYTLDDGGTIAGYIHESLVAVLDGSPAPPAKPGAPRKPEAAPKPARDDWSGDGTGRRGADNLFDIFLSAGGGDLGADDLNMGAQGLADADAALVGVAPGGSIGRLNIAWLLGAEVFFRLNARFSVGVGLDAMAGRNSSHIAHGTSGLPLISPATSVRPGLVALPIKAGVRFYPRPEIYIRGSV